VVAQTPSVLRSAKRYRAEILTELRASFSAGIELELRVHVQEAEKGLPPTPHPKAAAKGARASYAGFGQALSSAHDVLWFAPEANELALRFVQNVVDEPGQYGPLIFFGAAGLGKTHLAQAVGLESRRRFPKRKVIYITVEGLLREFQRALSSKTIPAFRARYRELDLLILDDLHHLGSKPKLQQMLLPIIDALDGRGAQLVLAGPLSPRNIRGLQASLKSRLGAGIQLELNKPSPEQRLAILERQQRRQKACLQPSVLKLVARRFPDNIRTMLGALTKLLAFERFTKLKVDPETARRALGEMFASEDEKPSPALIARQVGLCLGLSAGQICSGGRTPAVVRARQLAMALTRDLTSLTLAEIGKAFGKRSPGAVHFAIARIAELCSEDQKVQKIWATVQRHFRPFDELS